MNGMGTSLHGLGYQHEYVPHVSYASERIPADVHPSLWMTPTSTASPSPHFAHQPFNSLTQLAMPNQHLPESLVATSSTSSTQSILTSTSSKSTAPTSANSPKTTRQLSEFLADELFSAQSPTLRDYSTSSFPSPIASGSPDLKSTGLAGEDADPEKLAKEDPLGTQMWKMYAKTKATLPHAQRMENLSWRMMGLVLRKQKEDEERAKLGELRSPLENSLTDEPDASSARPPGVGDSGEGSSSSASERGRTIDKGKATRVKVVVISTSGLQADRSQMCLLLSPARFVLLLTELHPSRL